MTAHSRLHRPHWHLPHLRLEQLLFAALVSGLALFVLQQVLHPSPPAELTRAGCAAEVRAA